MLTKKNYLLSVLYSKTGAAFLIASIVLVYVGPFLLFETSSTQAAWVRYLLLLSSVMFFLYSRDELKKIDKVHLFLLVSLFGYLLVNSLFLSEELRSIRRLVFVVFLFVPFLFLRLNVEVLENIIKVIAFSIFLFALFSLALNYVNDSLPTGYREGGLYQSGVRQIAYFGNTIVAALYYGTALLAAFYYFLTTKSKVNLFASSVVAAVLSLYIFLTFARTVWLAVGVGLVILLTLLYTKELRQRFIFIITLLVLAGVCFSLTKLGYEVGERGLSIRDEIWIETIRKIEGYWVFGHGLLNRINEIYVASIDFNFNYPHSLYLEILYQVGGVGLFIYLVFVFYSSWIYYQAMRCKLYGNLGALFLAILLGSTLAAIFDMKGWIDSPNYIWMWLWVPLALSFNFSKELKRSRLEESVCS